MTALLATNALLVVVSCSPREARAPEPAPPPTSAPAPEPKRLEWAPPQSPAQSMSCGELVLYRRALTAAGKAEHHPEVVITESRLAECPDRMPTAEACRAALADRRQLEAQGKGPRHPDVIMARAKVEACREQFGENGAPPVSPPDAAECQSLRARRAELLAAGKGERHPAVLELDARLESCR